MSMSLAFATEPHASPAFRSLERSLIIESDHPEVSAYLRRAYARLRIRAVDDDGLDRGMILCRDGPPQVIFNGQRIEFPDPVRLTTPFRAAYYGSRKLFRSSFRQSQHWWSLACAGLLVPGRAVIVTAGQGIDRTAVTLEILSRGAGFFSNEAIFVRKRDRLAGGFPRTILVRERHVKRTANERLRAVCQKAKPRAGRRGGKAWDFIDAGDVFGDAVFAEPAPVGAIVVVDRAEDGGTCVESLPIAVAACRIAPHLNVEAVGVDKIVEAAELIDGLPCFLVKSGGPGDAATAILAALGGAWPV